MAIIYQNPLKGVRDPNRLKSWVSVARDEGTSHLERREAISKLRGALKFYQKKSKSDLACFWLKQQIFECQEFLQSENKEEQDADR